MNNSLFGFFDPNAMLRKQTQQSLRRPSGTVPDSVKHSVIHTESPDATIHHVIIAACPFPVKDRADRGEFYMVAYVSIPIDWLSRITREFATQWDVQFIGPAGMIQKVPPVLSDMEDLLGERVYIGFDWCWLGGEKPVQQPTAEYIKNKLTQFVRTVRDSR